MHFMLDKPGSVLYSVHMIKTTTAKQARAAANALDVIAQTLSDQRDGTTVVSWSGLLTLVTRQGVTTITYKPAS